MGIAQGGYTFPVLLASDDGIAIHRNRFVPNEMDAVFRPLLAIDWGKIPYYLFPVDVDSELWEFAELVIPQVLELMGSGEPRILSRHLEETIPCWGIAPPDYQRRLRTKMYEVMDQASRRQFQPYLRENRDQRARQRLQTRLWDIISNPLTGSSDKRHKGWKQITLLYKQFLAFMKTGRDVPEQQVLDLRPE